MKKRFLKFLTITIFCLGLVRCHSHSVKDIDGNVYRTIDIGTQVWMAENLKTTRFCNGDAIRTTVPATLVIEDQISPEYQWAYDGDEKNVAVYGRLYTWYVATDKRHVCPAGWHVPADAEWTVLTDFLIKNGHGFGGGYKRMDIAKSMAAPRLWVADETPGSAGNDMASNNSSGFTALPGGGRMEDGNFHDIGHIGNWWSSTQEGKSFMQCLTGAIVNLPGGIFRNIYHDYCYVNSYSNNEKYGMSIRCLKDN